MGDQPVGPICGANLGTGWIDEGTRCRARSGAPGPARFVLQLVMGASPALAKEDEAQLEARAMMEYDIKVIAESGLAQTEAGKQIVKLLRTLNERKGISYGGTIEGSRADWDGQTIRISDDYRGRMMPTIIELVHEASHALWRRKHPRPAAADARRADDVADELLARENQLRIYVYLRDKRGFPEDELMERRLRLQAAGKLAQAVEDEFPALSTADAGAP